MVADCLLVRRDVYAIDLVIRHEAFNPLDSGQGANHTAGFLRDASQVCGSEIARSWNIAFDYEFRHERSPLRMSYARARDSTSFCSESMTSPRGLGPRSPLVRWRTDTVPASASFAPTTSI